MSSKGIRRSPGRRSVIFFLSLAAGSALPVHSQNVLTGPGGGSPTILGTDLAVFELREPRKDLPCTVSEIKPLLGFDLRFHSGYEITVPMRELAGSENSLNILFRVRPEGKDEAVYFTHRFRVPALPEDAKGDAYLQGAFDLGEGKYQVDWLMRDRSERVCSSFWETEAVLAPKDKQLALELKAGDIVASQQEQFTDEPPIERAPQGAPLNVKVLIHFAPQNPNSNALQPVDTGALVSILRVIARDSRVTRFSLIAFNLQQERVLYRQEASDHIDFPALGDALKGLQLGLVDYSRLSDKNRETDFLSNLLREEFATQTRPDALIFAGPKVMLAENVPVEHLRAVGEPDYPVFYMNYNLYPQVTPWRDAISHAVKFFKGQEYTISRPRDLWFAVTDMMSKIVKLKTGKSGTATAAFQQQK